MVRITVLTGWTRCAPGAECTACASTGCSSHIASWVSAAGAKDLPKATTTQSQHLFDSSGDWIASGSSSTSGTRTANGSVGAPAMTRRCSPLYGDCLGSILESDRLAREVRSPRYSKVGRPGRLGRPGRPGARGDPDGSCRSQAGRTCARGEPPGTAAETGARPSRTRGGAGPSAVMWQVSKVGMAGVLRAARRSGASLAVLLESEDAWAVSRPAGIGEESPAAAPAWRDAPLNGFSLQDSAVWRGLYDCRYQGDPGRSDVPLLPG